jgi:hypothetical protein
MMLVRSRYSGVGMVKARWPWHPSPRLECTNVAFPLISVWVIHRLGYDGRLWWSVMGVKLTVGKANVIMLLVLTMVCCCGVVVICLFVRKAAVGGGLLWLWWQASVTLWVVLWASVGPDD